VTQTPATPATPAGWYADPHDPTQYRYWDGTQWTEHRSPRTATSPSGQQLTQAGNDLADGISTALNSFGNWVQTTSVTAATTAATTTFASVAASCRDEPARQPLSRTVELVLTPTDVEGVRQLFAHTSTPVTPEGTSLDNEVVRLVPNPWDPADPKAVAVFVGAVQVGKLPADVAADYSAPLTQLTTKQLLATGTGKVWAQGHGLPAGARVTVQIPEASAFA
jgi:Protein of unknown function (DUF2510)